MIDTIELPEEFFFSLQVHIVAEQDDLEYPIFVYGFDGNMIFDESTTIHALCDMEDDLLSRIGEYLVQNWRTIQ